MMKSMIKEKAVSFKEIEEEIYRMFCEEARAFTKELLERYDQMLMDGRDKKAYRNKGLRKSSVKTVYGEVEYCRRVYETVRADGIHEFVYLIDEQLGIPCVGLISHNLAEQLVSGVTEMSYRQCAEKVSAMTGQSISAMGVWNVIQALGESVHDEDEALIKAHKDGSLHGEIESSVLFEEMDGVHIRLQREQQDSAEMKVAMAYSGWEKAGKNRYALRDVVAAAGFSSVAQFKKYKEAMIAQRYDTDEICTRLINADGADWIKSASDPEAIFQLDVFHRNKAIRKNISDKKAVNDIYWYLNKTDVDGLLEYIETYKNSLSDDNEIKKAEGLLKYFKDNKDGLIPYKERDIRLPMACEGIEYRNMGTMENHIWSIIARRMKHNHTSWTKKGGNNLARILARKCSGRLNEVAAKLKTPVYESVKINEMKEDILSAAKISRIEGKGYEYPRRGHLKKLERSTGITRDMLLSFIC